MPGLSVTANRFVVVDDAKVWAEKNLTRMIIAYFRLYSFVNV
jgi:hypothetical protein